ncbi:hypothetical protein BCR35DRAFT_304225 [Leucosporidium creatinivorum]|uniref:STEEP1 domain-containing protein n=1 Tax=Leucosporidium creatinivorum TaxID=106004 RepID=A0A1Y2F9S8_9BASI|nr:hypothetical protein BCR35DRAFT_304225 [Leucosporidium creatinivorum]
MPKVIGRNVVSKSKEEDTSIAESLTVYYCLCGEFLMVAQTLLTSLPRRPTDGAYTLRNTGENKTVYKLNAGPLPDGKGSEGVLVRRGTEFEYQRGLYCERCQLQVAYETVPGEGKKGEATFLLPGAMTDAQGKLPAEVYGDASL